MAPPFAKIEFDLMYGEGISAEGDVLDLGVKKDLIEKSGAWYSIKGERMGQGRDQAKNFLKENPSMMVELRKQILAAYNIKLTENRGGATDIAGRLAESEKRTATDAKAAERAVAEKAAATPVAAKKAASTTKSKH